MKKLIFFSMIILMSAYPIAQASEKPKDTLIITLRNDLPPLSFLNIDGQPAGFLVDMWKLWAEKTGQKIDIRVSAWKDTVESFKKGSADVHGAIFFSEERSQRMIFSQPFYELSMCVFFLKNKGVIQTIKELSGQKIGVIEGTAHIEALRKNYPDIDIVPFYNIEDLIHGSREGKIRAFISSSSSVSVILNRLGLTSEFESTDETLFARKLRAGVLKHNTKLLALIDKGFDNISDKEFAEIESRWMQDPEKHYYKNAHLIRLTDAEETWLNHHKTVRIAIPAVFPPLMSLAENNRFKGVIPDYLDLFEKRTGIRFEPIAASLSELPEQIKTRQIDMFPAFMDIQSDQFLNLTESCFSLSWVIVNRIGDPFYRNERDLEGLKVSVVKNVPIHNYILRKYPGIEFQTYNKPSDALNAVSTGKTDAFVGALPVVGYSIQKNQIANLKIASSSGADDFLFRFAVRSDFPELTSIINKAIRSVTKQEHDDIFHKQMPIRYQYAAEWKTIWLWVLSGGGLFGIFFGISLLWNRKLTKEVEMRKQVEKLLQVSLEKYRVLFESFPVGVSVTNKDGNLIEVNRESERLLGVSAAGRRIDGLEWKIIRPDGVLMSAEEYASVRAFKTQQLVENVEMGIIKESQEITWINVHAAPIPIEGYGVVITYHDITDRKQAEASLRTSEAKYRTFFESIEQGVVYQDADGNITAANPAAERIMGLKADQMKGRTFSDFVWRIIREDGTDFTSDEHPSMISLRTGRELRGIIMGIFSVSKADITWIRVSAVPQFNLGEAKPYQVYSIFEDITDKKLAENSRKWEIKSLRQYSEPQKSVITSEYLGVKPLRTAVADVFEEFVGKYEEWMELALEKELFKVDNNISTNLQNMAERLGFFYATPRDLVEIHVKALQHKTEKLSSRKAQLYADVGRIMLLELMGYLLSFYRNRCVGVTTIRGTSNEKKA